MIVCRVALHQSFFMARPACQGPLLRRIVTRYPRCIGLIDRHGRLTCAMFSRGIIAIRRPASWMLDDDGTMVTLHAGTRAIYTSKIQ